MTGKGTDQVRVLDNTLTLTFGQDGNEGPLGFDLAANQIDLMVAFSDVDNRKEDANVAELDFRRHHFAQIVIEAASIDENADIIVDEVVFYGNHKATTGPMTFTNEEDGVTATYEIDAATTTDSYTEPETVYGKQVDAIVNQLKSRLPASHIGSECPENIIRYNSNDRYQLRCVKE